MTKEEAIKIWANSNGTIDGFEKLGMIKFDKPETKLEKFKKWLHINYSHPWLHPIIINKVKEIYGED